ncbi:hypothetical protein [Streptomyces sp. NPDC008122]|uniref:hypothetical protein n=1 Tax=Streptomyces sp. NPDC008122 TaxID=3364810 RepID=UPI0036F022BD
MDVQLPDARAPRADWSRTMAWLMTTSLKLKSRNSAAGEVPRAADRPLGSIVAELTSSPLIDYQRRREHLADWTNRTLPERARPTLNWSTGQLK